MREALRGQPLIEVPVPTTTSDLLEQPYHGIPGKARAMHAVMSAATRLGSRGCVIADAGSMLSPDMIVRLAEPVMIEEGLDFVSPYHDRAPHEGALTKGLVYPFVRALYGARLRQPAAAEFGCSARLLDRLLEEDLFDGEGAQAGIDVWVTTAAAAGGFRLGEAMLGPRPPSLPGDEAPDLTTTLRQVVGALFADMELRADTWLRVRGDVPVTVLGASRPTPPAAVTSAEVERRIESFRLGCRDLRDVWTWVLPPKTIVQLSRLAEAPLAAFRMDGELWARIVYDFALAYRMRALPRDHLMGSLVPLYLGWLGSFLLQLVEEDDRHSGDQVERLAAAFEAQKPYLIARWRWPEQLRS